MTATAKKTTAPTSPAKRKDATALLRADHKLVSELFAEYEKARSVTKKKQLVSQICTELSVHAQVEEEIFYPAVKLALKDKELVPEATVEHATLKDLIAQVEGMSRTARCMTPRSRCFPSTSNTTSRKSKAKCSRKPKRLIWTCWPWVTNSPSVKPSLWPHAVSACSCLGV